MPANITCPINWTTLGKGCYLFLDSEKRNWKEAKEKCEQEGGYLTEVDSKEENQAIVNYIIAQKWQSAEKEFWIGLHKVQGIWQWDHSGMELGDESYSNWWHGKLSWDREGKCVHYNGVNEWDNKLCDRDDWHMSNHTYHAFCEFAADD